MGQPYGGELEPILTFLEKEMNRSGTEIATEDDVASFVDVSGQDFGLGLKPQRYTEAIIESLKHRGVAVETASTKDRIINSVLKEAKTMKEWKSEAFYKVFNTDWLANLKGTNGWELHWSSERPESAHYTLSNETIHATEPDESKFKESKNYFYAKVMDKPEIYSYVSNKVGGAITFRGKGRWSGNAKNFGEDIGKKLTEISIGGAGSFAIAISDFFDIVKRNFPGLKYKEGDGEVVINWQKYKK
jgi:hypothetical protein